LNISTSNCIIFNVAAADKRHCIQDQQTFIKTGQLK